jgi:hypothetical protein
VNADLTEKAEKAVTEVQDQVRSISQDSHQVWGPVLLQKLISSATASYDPGDRLIAQVFEQVSELSDKMQAFSNDLGDLRDMSKGSLNFGGIDAGAEYINGEEEAFEALTTVTQRAKYVVRSTRFFEHSVVKRQPAYSDAMVKRITGNDLQPALEQYYRIVAINHLNHREKKIDIMNHLTICQGRPFDLYLTSHDNAFELVIVDNTDAFIHFYKEKKVIASTLHIKQKDVVEEFAQIFDRLKDRDIIRHFDCRKITADNLPEVLSEVGQIFDNCCKEKTNDEVTSSDNNV